MSGRTVCSLWHPQGWYRGTALALLNSQLWAGLCSGVGGKATVLSPSAFGFLNPKKPFGNKVEMGVLQLTFCSCSMVNGNDASTPLNMSRNSVSLWAPCNSKAALCFQLQKLLLVVLYKLAAPAVPKPRSCDRWTQCKQSLESSSRCLTALGELGTGFNFFGQQSSVF